MTAQERYQYYDPNNWVHDKQSGFNGYRNKVDNKWLTTNTYYSVAVDFRKEYETKLKLLQDFRIDYLHWCITEVTEEMILEFLEGQFAK